MASKLLFKTKKTFKLLIGSSSSGAYGFLKYPGLESVHTYLEERGIPLAADKVYDYCTYGPGGPRPRDTKHSEDEGRITFPLAGLEGPHIKLIRINKNNDLVVLGESKPDNIFYKQHRFLPSKANFEYAIYSTTFVEGLLTVSIKKFKKKNVTLEASMDDSRGILSD